MSSERDAPPLLCAAVNDAMLNRGQANHGGWRETGTPHAADATPVHCVFNADGRTVPRGGFAAAQDDTARILCGSLATHSSVCMKQSSFLHEIPDFFFVGHSLGSR